MSDSQSLNTSMLEVMISSKNEHIFIQDLSDHTLQIIFHTLWASMNVDSKHLKAWNNSRHAPWWRFYFHWRIEETGSTGFISIVCHHILRHPSEHETSSVGKPLLAIAHTATLIESSESEVTQLTSSMDDETALAIVKRQRRPGIGVVCS
jgi:hypothetical protein